MDKVLRAAPAMDIHIHVGEWLKSLLDYMTNAEENTCFHVPTSMHLHAFWLMKNSHFPERNFKVLVENTEGVK
jgi:hypothetical protein